MRGRDIEKKIYECLGVNVFRKYVLFNYEKFWKAFHMEEYLGYRLDAINIGEIKKHKIRCISKALIHLVSLGLIPVLYGYSPTSIIFMLFDACCIMVQRYNSIRIDEILEKHEKLAQKREEKQKQEEISNDNLVLSNQLVKENSSLATEKEKLIRLREELLGNSCYFNELSYDESDENRIYSKSKNPKNG